MFRRRPEGEPAYGDLEQDLRRRVDGEVRFDAGSLGAYSTDASNYRQVPMAVVIPRTVDDAVEAVAVCREHDAPLLSRGGGTSLAGQCCNHAVVIDWSKYCHRLVSVDEQRRTAVVEPGIVLDSLNRQLESAGLMVGPKPSTHDCCTLGGMLGNNACGASAQAYGKMADSTLALEILTYDGLRTWVRPTTDEEFAEVQAAGGRKAQLYDGMRRLRDDHLAEIRSRYPHIPRRVSGYNLDALLPESGFDVARALVGSESTLVTILRAEVALVERPAAHSLVVLGYSDIATAADAVPAILPHRPSALEGVDQRLVELEQREGLAEQARRELPDGGGWLLVEFAGQDNEETEQQAQKLLDDLGRSESGPHTTFIDDPAREAKLWKAREAGLGATAYPPGGRETHEGWEDAAVPPELLGDYLRDFQALLERYGYGNSSLYGHFGQGCVHTRIPFDLRSARGIKDYRDFARDSARLVVSYGGSLSGEHGDGQSRGELLPQMFGPEITRAFTELKELFDPDNKMNPGKVVTPYRMDENLRQGEHYRPAEPHTHFSFPHTKHRFSQAAGRCVGVGACRSEEGGVMCPSYRVTREEEHSTRGRARLLFEMLRGDVISDGWRSTEVRDALDLCLACKGCRSDCPVNVDMATYKAEFLSHHYARRLRPPSHYSMGWLPLWARLAAVAPGQINRITHARGIADALKRAGGVDPRRDIPEFAGRRFTGSMRNGEPEQLGPRGTVVLWPDTFTNNFEPDIAASAVRVLRDAGFGVRVPRPSVCCGLTWISTGQLGVARRVLLRTLRVLRTPLRAGEPVVVLEPSCAAVFRADLPELLYGDEDANRLAAQTYTLAELLRDRAPDWEPPQLHAQAIAQPHCHQHAILGFDADAELLRGVGADLEVLEAGCCGLAGNFGFERGHYEVSMACAEDQLLPRLRASDSDTLVLADGFSCRAQIKHAGVERDVQHSAQLLAGALRRTTEAVA